MGTLKSIRALVGAPPLTDPGAMQVVRAGQFPFRLGGCALFLAAGEGGTRQLRRFSSSLAGLRVARCDVARAT